MVAADAGEGESRSDLLTEVRVGRAHSANCNGQFYPAALAEQFLRLYGIHGTPELECFYVPQPRAIISIQEKEIVSADTYPCERRRRARNHEKSDGVERSDTMIMARKDLQAVVFQCNDRNCAITRHAKQASCQWATFVIP